MLDKNASKVIEIKEYLEGRKEIKRQGVAPYKNRHKYVEDEERRRTLNLFMKVLATMERESYK